MKISKESEELFNLVATKSGLKTSVYDTTLTAFNQLKETIENLTNNYSEFHKKDESVPNIE